jgi:hypothetical protein
MRARRLLHRLRRLALGALLLGTLLLGLFLAPLTRDALEREISRRASRSLGLPVEVRGITWRWPLELRVDRLSVGAGEAEGRAENVAVEVADLGRTRLTLRSLRVDRLRWPAILPSLPPRPPEISAPGPSFAFAVQSLSVARVDPLPTRTLLPAGMRIQGEGEWAAAGGRLRLAAQGSGLRLTASGTWTGTIFAGRVRGALSAAAPLLASHAAGRVGGITGELEIAGDSQSCQGTLTAQLPAWGEFTLPWSWSRTPGSDAIAVHLFGVLHLAQFPAAWTRWIPAADFHAQAQLERARTRDPSAEESWRLRDFDLRHGPHQLTAREATLSPNGDWRVDRLRLRGPTPDHLPVAAQHLELLARLEGSLPRREMGAQVQAWIDTPLGLPASWAEALGSSLHAEALACLSPDGWRVEDFQLATALGTARVGQASGDFHGAGQAQGEVSVPNLNRLPLGLDLAGGAEAKGGASWDAEGHWSIAARVESPQLQVGPETARDVRLDLTLLPAPTGLAASGNLQLNWREAEWGAFGSALADGQGWRFPRLSLHHPTLSAQADLTWQAGAGWSGHAWAEACPPPGASGWPDWPWQGAVRFSAGRESAAAGVPWGGTWAVKGLAGPGVRVESGHGTWRWAEAILRVAGLAQEVGGGEWLLKEAALFAESDGTLHTGSARLEGFTGWQVAGSGLAHGWLSADAGEVIWEKLEGQAAGEVATVAAPARAVWQGHDLWLPHWQAHWRGAVLAADFVTQLDPAGAFLARLEVSDLGLEHLQWPAEPHLSGRLKGGAAAGGTWSSPQAMVWLEADAVRPVGLEADVWPAASLHAEAVWREGAAEARAAVQAEKFDLVAKAHWHPDEVSPLRANLQGNLDLAWLNRPAWAVHQVWQGRLEGALDVGGTLAEPLWTGEVRLRDARFEHAALGIDLRDLQGTLRAEGSRQAELRLSARGPGGGRLSGQGELRPGPEGGLTGGVTLELQNLLLWRDDFARVPATGTLRLGHAQGRLRLDGRLELAPVVVNLGASPEAAPPRFTVIDPARSNPPAPPVAAPPPEWAEALDLHLRLDVPGRLSVRGRGLDSEWAGRLELGGTGRSPRLTGELRPQRGKFDFFGQPFRLDEGRVVFAGEFPPAPWLELALTRSRGELDARLELRGPATQPAIRLTSSPSLPEDELLPRLLFGRGLGEVGPWQGVRMAQAAHALRGGGSAFDFMGRARRLLAVDQLHVQAGAEDPAPPRITAGKHLGDRLYLEGEGAVGAEDGRLSVELEISRRLSLATEVRQDERRGIGLKWKRDF